MEQVDRIGTLRKVLSKPKAEGKTISFVPTMGALHEGHKSCMKIARREGDVLVVSIYVNPKQFGPGEDFDSYPRTFEKDLEVCERLGCDVVFTPGESEIYPAPQVAWVTVEGLSGPLCGRKRPTHFRGVVTVVAKLFNIVDPDVAVFGQKDAQQALVIRELVRQLNFRVRLVLSPIVREPDGLAASSRNVYLPPEKRGLASGLYKSLNAGRKIIEDGERDPDVVTETVRSRLMKLGITDIEYVELLGSEDLSTLERVNGKVLLALAAKVETTRLIDNVVLDVGTDGSVRESMLF